MINSNKLKGAIAENGFTQTQLAQKLGISQEALSLKINNKRSFSLEEVGLLANLLELTESTYKSIFFA